MASAIKTKNGFNLILDNDPTIREFKTINELKQFAYDLGYSTIKVYNSSYVLIGIRKTRD